MAAGDTTGDTAGEFGVRRLFTGAFDPADKGHGTHNSGASEFASSITVGSGPRGSAGPGPAAEIPGQSRRGLRVVSAKAWES